MEVYSESGLEANIFFNPDFDGDGYADYQGFMDRRVAVTVDAGEVDFIVNQPVVFAEYCGYIVRDATGQIVGGSKTSNLKSLCLGFGCRNL